MVDLRRDKQGKVIAYTDLPWQEQQGGHTEHAKAYEAARLDSERRDQLAAQTLQAALNPVYTPATKVFLNENK